MTKVWRRRKVDRKFRSRRRKWKKRKEVREEWKEK